MSDDWQYTPERLPRWLCSWNQCADLAHDTRRMLQALDAYWIHYDGYHGEGNPRSESTLEDWWIRFEKYRARVESALARREARD